jgi:hypothetical protein
VGVVLRVACCMLRVACCVLHVACCVLRLRVACIVFAYKIYCARCVTCKKKTRNVLKVRHTSFNTVPSSTGHATMDAIKEYDEKYVDTCIKIG